jgi:hypothetical protein
MPCQPVQFFDHTGFSKVYFGETQAIGGALLSTQHLDVGK